MASGGRIVAKMLKGQGVRHVFTLCGLHVADIYAGCVDEGVAVVDTRHEQAAVHAADAYARLTRNRGVAVVTAGPGVTDAVTGVANAQAASSPVLLIGGAAPTSTRSRGALQEIEQVALFRPITKWAESVPSSEVLPSYLAKAFRTALSGRPGPVFLEVPWDVLNGTVDDADLPRGYLTAARPAGDPAYVRLAAAALAGAARPVVVAGSSVWWDDAAEGLARLADRLAAPVYLNGAGRGSLPPGHPSSLHLTRKAALADADVVLVLGTPLDFRLDYGEGIGRAATLVQVDADPTEIGRNRGADVGIQGDTRLVVDQLLEALGPAPAAGPGAAFLAAMRAAEAVKATSLAAQEADAGVPIHHSRLAAEVSDFANAPGRDPIFVADGGNFVAMAAKSIRLPGPGRWLDPGPLGCLGVGAPFAIAAKLLHPERLVVVLQGDGAFGFNGFDYETAVRFGLPMVVVVGNDAGWGQIRLPQVAIYGEDRSPATRLAATRYDRVVEAFGGWGAHVTRPEDIRPALERAAASGTVACVNVEIDPDAPAKSGMMGYAI